VRGRIICLEDDAEMVVKDYVYRMMAGVFVVKVKWPLIQSKRYLDKHEP
jgi:hypothetical protein